ncbi:MAG: M23 family metallopeptidase [Candidatus Eisenbacteria bacterium]
MQRKYLDLLVIPEGAGQVRRYRIPQFPKALFLGLTALALTLLTGAGVSYMRMITITQTNRALRDENDGLRRELLVLGGQIDRLDSSVRAHIRLANDSRLLAGLPPFSEEVALLGVGGMSGSGSGSEGLSHPLQQTVGLYRERLDRLGDQLGFQEESFVEVNQVISASKEKLGRIPTINPVQGPFSLSSGFGSRRDPFTGRVAFHSGIDLSAKRGTSFCAAADGQVIFAGHNGDLGLVIQIDHQNGFVTLYGHADRLLAKQGQFVRRGDVIGAVGRTGRSTGDHLHYEIHKDQRPVNPRKYILQS